MVSISGWWFGAFFIFHNIWDNPSHWRTHIFQRGRSTTHQICSDQWWLIHVTWSIAPQWLRIRGFPVIDGTTHWDLATKVINHLLNGMILQVGQCMLLCCCRLFLFQISAFTRMWNGSVMFSPHWYLKRWETVLVSIKCCTVVFALGWVSQFVSFFPLTNCGDHNNPFGGFCHLNKPTSLAQIYVDLVHWIALPWSSGKKSYSFVPRLSLWGARRKGAVPGGRHRTFRIFRT